MSTLEEISERKCQLVRIDTTVKAELDDIGKKKETYSNIIRRLLENYRETKQIA